MAQEVHSLSLQLQAAEAESEVAYDQREELHKLLVDMRAQHQIQISQRKSKIQALERKNRALRDKNQAVAGRVSHLQLQVDAVVAESWREHIYAQQSTDWFRDFERKMMN